MPISKTQQKQLRILGQRLRDARLKGGLTLKELGYRVNKDPQSISRVEMGDINPSFLYLLDLCKGLEIEVSEILIGFE